MKHFLAACLSLFIGQTVFSQDTISTYLNSLGEPCDLGSASYFLSSRTGGTYRINVNIEVDIEADIPYNLPLKSKFDPPLRTKRGVYVFLDSTGRIRRQINYVDNAYQGEFVLYYPSGTIRNKENYENSKRHGNCSYYYENGKLSSEEVYDQDSLMTYKVFNLDGSIDNTNQHPTRAAEFPGGLTELANYLGDSIQYPESALINGVSGRVYLRFEITESGNIENAKVVRGIASCPDCSAASLRALEYMPAWIPGRKHNRVVKSYFALPVKFEITDVKTQQERKGFFRRIFGR